MSVSKQLPKDHRYTVWIDARVLIKAKAADTMQADMAIYARLLPRPDIATQVLANTMSQLINLSIL